MKKVFLVLLVSLISIFSFAQSASRVSALVAVPTYDTVPLNFLFMDTLSQPSGVNYQFRVGRMSFLINHIQTTTLSSVNSAFIATKLGYIPVSPSDLSPYLLTSNFDAMFNTKFGQKNTDGLVEGSNNLYWTTARFNTQFNTKTTSDLPEGSNQYWTLGRFNTAFGTKSTSDLAEGSNQYFTNARAIAAVTWSTLTGKPTFATVANSGSYTDLTNKPTIPSALAITPTSIASGARNFNQAYQVSASKYADIRVSAQISANLSLTGGQAGEIYLEYSADGSTGWTLAGRITGSNTGALTIGLNTTQVTGGQISTILQPGYYWRLRTNNVTGTPTYTFTGGVELTYN